MVHAEVAPRPTRSVLETPSSEGGEGWRGPTPRKWTESSVVVADERRSRREPTGGCGVTAIAEVHKWEADRVAGYVTG